MSAWTSSVCQQGSPRVPDCGKQTWFPRGDGGVLCSHDGALGKKALDISLFHPLSLASISALTPKFQYSHLPPNRRANIPAPQHFLTDGPG